MCHHRKRIPVIVPRLLGARPIDGVRLRLGPTGKTRLTVPTARVETSCLRAVPPRSGPTNQLHFNAILPLHCAATAFRLLFFFFLKKKILGFLLLVKLLWRETQKKSIRDRSTRKVQIRLGWRNNQRLVIYRPRVSIPPFIGINESGSECGGQNETDALHLY